MAVSSSILAVGNDRMLLASRSLVMRAAGYVVLEATNYEQALRDGTSDRIDAVVICHSLEPKESGHLIQELMRARRRLPIICVLKNEFNEVPPGCLKTTAEPEDLLRTLRFVLVRQPHSAPRAKGIA